MARRKSEDKVLTITCEECSEWWEVDGRFNAEGVFEPFDEEDMECETCGEPGSLGD